jgi:hypothetical protein
MKIVFCIDDNPRYLMLLKVAVRSLRRLHGPDAPCLCVYAGDREDVLETLAAEAIPLARYRPRLAPELLPQSVQHSVGCFLKLELALVEELAADDMALYCDVDVLFYRPLNALFAMQPRYMGMAREYTAPFYHQHEQLSYMFRERRYVVPMPFPIWTFSSGVVLFNFRRLRRRGLLDHFLAFSLQNVDRIGNLDQSLLNYYFGKRITQIDGCWNHPPYQADCLERAHIIHFHGPKPWDTKSVGMRDLRINHFETLRHVWLEHLRPDERELLAGWD